MRGRLRPTRIVVGLGIALAAGLAMAPRASAHGGAIVPPPQPPPTPPWMKGDPYAPLPPTGGPKPFDPPAPLKPGTPPPPPPTTPGGLPITPTSPRPGFLPGHVPVPPTTPAPGTDPVPVPTPAPPTTPANGAASSGGSSDAPPPTPKGRRDRSSLPGRRGAGAGDDAWARWWDVNADALRAEGGPVIRVAVTGDDAERAAHRARVRETEVVPYLRTVVATGRVADPDLHASGLIALAKTTSDPTDVARIVAVLADPAAAALAREGAAIALGCLRRTDPAARLDGRTLDRIRGRLLDAIDDDAVPIRTRCFAALALGLLGDQPGCEGDAFAKDLRGTSQALWARLCEPRAGNETTVALLVALSLQPPGGIPSGVRDALRALASTGRLAGRERGDVAQAHGVLAYARLVGPECAGMLLGLAKASHQPGDVRRSAILALGVLARSLDGTMRTAAVAELLVPARRGDPDTAGFALIAVGRLVDAGFADPEDKTTGDGPGGAALLDLAGHGQASVRPFAALALALATRPLPGATTSASRARLRDDAIRAYAAVVDRASEDPDARAACALGLGVVRAGDALARLGRLLGDGGLDADVRARAATAIGLLGEASPEALAALRAALAPRSPDEVRREAARSLGALGDTAAVADLVREVRASTPDHVRARAAVALGAIGAMGAAKPLLALAADATAGEGARAVAVAALGLLVDPEAVRSLSRLGIDTNYLARTDALNEALSLL